jgi:N-acetylated-alpha-linked acidic dipeptidase
MMLVGSLHLLAFSATCVTACNREYLRARVFDHQLALSKRQDSPSLPALDANEAILLNSFDNTTIESWSYYYTHGLHVAGTNRSMAQWTADRWHEFGFDAQVVQYCECPDLPV